MPKGLRCNPDQECSASSGAPRRAFTLVQVMVAVALAGIMFVSPYAAIASAFNTVRSNRENLRATQVLLEITEMLRLYTWDQIIGNDTNTYVPATFTAPYYPDSRSGGFDYNGTVITTNAPLGIGTYSTNMRSVTIGLTWISGNTLRTRSMTTLVSRYGLQNYIF